MTDSNKMWVKPQLIVLVRSNPAEAVMLACKIGGVYGGSSAAANHCQGGGDTSPCTGDCYQRSRS